MHPTDFTLAGAIAALDEGAISAVELTRAHVDAMEALNPRLNAFITTTPEAAMEAAKASDAKRARGEAGPLEGIPLAIKDLFCTEGVQTTAGSKILGGFVPPYESTVTSQLKRDGAVFLGKANLDEFAMGSSNLTSAYGGVVNPWSRRNDPTCGWCRVGPRAGRRRRWRRASHLARRDRYRRVDPPASGLLRHRGDQADLWAVLALRDRGVCVLARPGGAVRPHGRGLRDPAAVDGRLRSEGFDQRGPAGAGFREGLHALGEGAADRRAEGIPPGRHAAEIERLWRQGLDWLRDAGAEIVDITLPHTKYALPTYYIVAPAEASSNLARYDGVRFGLRAAEKDSDLRDLYERTREAGFGQEVRRRIMIGTYVLSAGYYDAYYLKAQKVRALIARDFREAFAGVDAIVTPATPSARSPRARTATTRSRCT